MIDPFPSYRQSIVDLEAELLNNPQLGLTHVYSKLHTHGPVLHSISAMLSEVGRTTVSQDVQTRFPVQLTFAKFLSKIKEIFNTVPVSWIQHSLRNFPLF